MGKDPRGGSSIRPALWPLLAAALLCATTAQARITSIEVLETRPFAEGRDFGAGPYRIIRAMARGELDPADPRNAIIADIAIAPRNARGRVEYATEVEILRPVDPARASGRLVHEVTNRGRKLMLAYLQDATVPQARMNRLDGADAVGNALALRLGHTLVWNGWDPDVPRADGNLSIALPVIEGVTADIRDEFVFGVRLPASRAEAPLSYPVAGSGPRHVDGAPGPR